MGILPDMGTWLIQASGMADAGVNLCPTLQFALNFFLDFWD
jgi:hypothetical protein